MAETIAIVVHGVGDHSATAILDEAAAGFRALTNGAESVEPMTLGARSITALRARPYLHISGS